MRDLQPLLALLAQTEHERDDALASHARAVAQHRAAQDQSEQLSTYRKEYEQRWAEHFKQNSSIELMHCYQAFTQRLALALAHQERAQAQAEEQVAGALAVVQSYEMRVASVKKLIERRLNEQRLHAEQLEQKLTDEFASRVRWRPPAFSPNTTY
jgi:flagellar protein FliJ